MESPFYGCVVSDVIVSPKAQIKSNWFILKQFIKAIIKAIEAIEAIKAIKAIEAMKSITAINAVY